MSSMSIEDLSPDPNILSPTYCQETWASQRERIEKRGSQVEADKVQQLLAVESQ